MELKSICLLWCFAAVDVLFWFFIFILRSFFFIRSFCFSHFAILGALGNFSLRTLESVYHVWPSSMQVVVFGWLIRLLALIIVALLGFSLSNNFLPQNVMFHFCIFPKDYDNCTWVKAIAIVESRNNCGDCLWFNGCLWFSRLHALKWPIWKWNHLREISIKIRLELVSLAKRIKRDAHFECWSSHQLKRNEFCLQLKYSRKTIEVYTCNKHF